MSALNSQSTEDKSRSPQRPDHGGCFGDERGVALILALVMLVLLSILGAWALSTSSTDLRIAGNFRNMQVALYAADAMVAYGTNPATLTTAYTSGAAVWSPGHNITVVTGSTGQASVEFIRSGPLPAGSIYDADVDVDGNSKFYGLYFAINATGNGGNNAAVTIENSVAQVVGK